MYELYKINEDHYQIHSTYSNVRAMEGTLLAIGTYLVYSLGFYIEEVEAALLDMNDKDHDAAQFGFECTFIYSFNKNEKYKKAS